MIKLFFLIGGRPISSGLLWLLFILLFYDSLIQFLSEQKSM